MSGLRDDIFWSMIEALDESGLLEHVMIIGSWAEYLYPEYFAGEFGPSLRTHDIDIYFKSYYREVPGSEVFYTKLKERGFVPYDAGAGVEGFFKEGMEVEFLTCAFGDERGMVEIPNVNLLAERLSSTSLLIPMTIEARGYEIQVPTPASYIVHKLYINPDRKPPSKREKDLEAIKGLVEFIRRDPQELERLTIHIRDLAPEVRERVFEAAESNGITIC